MLKINLLFCFIFFMCSGFVNAQWQWAHSFGGPSFDEACTVASDHSNNCYLSGRFGFNFQIGAFNLIGHPSYNDVFISMLDNNGNVIWATEAGGADDDVAYDIATDNLGNCIVTGYFNNTADFDGTLISSNGDDDVFIAKYDASGNLSWLKSFGSMYEDFGYRVCIDNTNNIFVTGEFRDSITVDGTTIYSTYKGIFIVKYDNNGVFKWIKNIRSTGNLSVSGITVDNSNNLYVSGNFSLWLYSGTDSIYNYSSNDLFLVKLDASGNTVWLQDGAGQLDNIEIVCNSSTTDNFGNTYLTGTFPDTIHFGIHSAVVYGNPWENDAFLCKFDSTGNKIWIRHGGGIDDYDAGLSVVNDVAGNIFLSGDFFGTSIFGNVTIINNFTLYASSLLVKYDSAGNALWGIKTIETINDCRINKIAIQDSSLYLSGFHRSQASMGSFNFNGYGYYDVIAGKLNGFTSNVSEHTGNDILLIYPNPAGSTLTIVLTDKDDAIITNLLGEKIMEEVHPFKTSGRIVLDISTLANGIYFIHAGDRVQKFLKQ